MLFPLFLLRMPLRKKLAKEELRSNSYNFSNSFQIKRLTLKTNGRFYWVHSLSKLIYKSIDFSKEELANNGRLAEVEWKLKARPCSRTIQKEHLRMRRGRCQELVIREMKTLTASQLMHFLRNIRRMSHLRN